MRGENNNSSRAETRGSSAQTMNRTDRYDASDATIEFDGDGLVLLLLFTFECDHERDRATEYTITPHNTCGEIIFMECVCLFVRAFRSRV